MPDFASELQRLIQEQGLSTRQLEERSGVSRSQISAAARGANTKGGTRLALAVALTPGVVVRWPDDEGMPTVLLPDASPEELELLQALRSVPESQRAGLVAGWKAQASALAGLNVGGTPAEKPPAPSQALRLVASNSPHAEKREQRDEAHSDRVVDAHSHRVVAPIAAGEDGWISFERLADEVEVPASIGAKHHWQAVEVRGDSMEPTIPAGSYVFFASRRPGQGGLAVVEGRRSVGGDIEGWVKRVRWTDDSTVMESDNPAYDRIELDASNVKRCVLVELVWHPELGVVDENIAPNDEETV